MKNILVILLITISVASFAQKDILIQGALHAAPEALREGATVLGYGENGEMTTLREGSNKMICVADDPSKEGFYVVAYHKDLEPFMQRGRALRKEGKKRNEIFEIREEEVKEGKLEIPRNVTLHALSGDSFDSENNEVVNPYMRWVVYIPYATEESTGLPLAPIGPGAPWLMDAGTHRAHIMITPPKDK